MINMTKEEYDEYSKEWEEWSGKQGTWPYTPEDPLLDQQTADTTYTQRSLHSLVAQTVQADLYSTSDQS